ncbi:hypothetical protein BC828DRAFT_374695 [Blastocladiella britannica]|nr:hypothetical protein BC828DRAFT_374695 [Blastocladiella britannica]
MTTTTNDAMPPPKAAAAKRALSETQENASERPEQSKRARLRRPHLPPPPSIAPHPLGIRPLGNLPFAKQEPGFVDTRASGLGTRTFARLDDEFVLAFVVNYLDPRSLCALAGTSRAWMAFWEYDEIWKGWVLEHWRDQPTKPKRFAASTGLWRHTYAMAVRPTYHPKPWTPVHAHHMHSDLLYQAHLNAVTPLAHAVATLDALTDMGVFRRLDTVDRPTADQFRARYEEPSVPVVLRGCMTTWSALRDWEWTKLEAAAGQVPLRAEAIDMTLSEYLAYLRTAPPDEAPVYLFDKDYPRQGEAGAKLAAAFAVPEYFTADLFSVLGPTRPDFSWLIIGPERSGSSHHKDPNLTAAWNAVVRGKKLWVMYPPDLVPPGVYPSDDGAEVTTPNSVSEWFRTWLPLTRQLVKGVPREGRPLWGICGEGEIMFVPHGYASTFFLYIDVNTETLVVCLDGGTPSSTSSHRSR